MGQAQIQGVRKVLPGQMAVVTERLLLHATEIKQLASLTYEQFVESVSALNEIAKTFSDSNGKTLVFHIKKGSDETVLWRATVRIKCSKTVTDCGYVESTKVLTFKQYVHVYNEIVRQAAAAAAAAATTTTSEHGENVPAANLLDASIILMQLDDESCCRQLDRRDEEECIICMDRKAMVILPCTHAYCEQCIDAWQGSHQTCPICRAAVKNSKESWVLSEKPNEHEMASEASGYVMGLIDRQPTDSDSSDEY